MVGLQADRAAVSARHGMNADPIRIRELLSNMADAERRLRQLAEAVEETFLADYRNTESAKYLLIVATESAIDVCNHLVARLGGRAPEDYADCFTVLTTLGVIESDLAQRLRQMARFRNLLVHLYWQVDDRRVYRILHENLNDLGEFRRCVRDWLNL
jgi:uncharacterized protein YutE (UPF0331/DUF86 family)